MKKNKKLLAIIMILALVATGLVIYFVAKNNSDSKKKDMKAKTKTEQVKKEKTKKTEEKAKEENADNEESSSKSSKSTSSGSSKKSSGGSSSGGGSTSGGGGGTTGGGGSGGSGGGQTGHAHQWVTGTETNSVYTCIGSHTGYSCGHCHAQYDTYEEMKACCPDFIHGWASCVIPEYGYLYETVTYTYCATCGARR